MKIQLAREKSEIRWELIRMSTCVDLSQFVINVRQCHFSDWDRIDETEGMVFESMQTQG